MHPPLQLCAGDGRQAAAHLLQWGAAQACPHPAQFVADMEELFRQQCDIQSAAGIDLDGVMKATLHLARKHEVRARGTAGQGCSWVQGSARDVVG